MTSPRDDYVGVAEPADEKFGKLHANPGSPDRTNLAWRAV